MARRRLIAIVVAGALGLATLTGCRLETGSAAYVGATRVSQQQVEDMLAAYQRDGGSLQTADRPQARRSVTAEMVFVAVARRFATEKGYATPAFDYAAAATQSSLPASDPYLRMHVQAVSYQQLLLQNSAAVTPTEADYREIYQRLVAGGLTASYQQIKPELQQINGIGAGLGLRNALTAAAKRYGVELNPLYGDIEYPLVRVSGTSGGTFVLVAVPLGSGGSPAVVDAR
ncbi:MAG: hypothetical protein V7603_2820 [Micromonosporaceae bacterium]